MVALLSLRLLGSIAGRRSISKIANASGKNFIFVSVGKPGGAGAMIARPMSSQIGLPQLVKIKMPITIASSVTFNSQKQLTNNDHGLARNFW
jgi:hypothetical protein